MTDDAQNLARGRAVLDYIAAEIQHPRDRLNLRALDLVAAADKATVFTLLVVTLQEHADLLRRCHKSAEDALQAVQLALLDPDLNETDQ